MKSHYLNRFVASCLTVLFCVGCEYEWKDEPVRSEPEVVQIDNGDEARSSTQVVKVTVAPSDVRPVLAPGKSVSGEAAVPNKAKKLNLPEMLEQGQLTISSNVSGLGGLEMAIDEVESSLAKSEGTNPFKITLQFSREVNIKAVRVLSSYSDYGWAVEATGSPRLVVDTVVDGQWSTMAFPEGLKTKTLTVEVLRKLRDNYVHLNEIELYE
jgi:hypothetical protein